MNSYVVITTINSPSAAVRKWAKLFPDRTVVVGDLKTPVNYAVQGAKYIAVDDKLRGRHEGEVLPFNHYCRKMLGYLYAIDADADCIVDTDDDNIPYDDYIIPRYDGTYREVQVEGQYYNIYKPFTDSDIWPRGYPLELVRTQVHAQQSYVEKKSSVGVWQSLADGDPDIDAICRLLQRSQHVFNKIGAIVLPPYVVSPFNSQNTAFRRELFALLYLPTSVSFRYTDILRSYVALPCMWAMGYVLGIHDATVLQERNDHDVYADMLSEVPMYKTALRANELARSTASSNSSLASNIWNIYEALVKENIVLSNELATLSWWLKTIQKLSSMR